MSKWIRTDEHLPPTPGNYFVTYFAPIGNKNDVTDLFWNGNKWELRGDEDVDIVLNIIAWCEHPSPYVGPAIQSGVSYYGESIEDLTREKLIEAVILSDQMYRRQHGDMMQMLNAPGFIPPRSLYRSSEAQ